MNNPFIVKNGLLVDGNAIFSGSVSASLGIVNQLQVNTGTPASMTSNISTASYDGINTWTVVDAISTSSGNSAKWLISINDGTNFKTSEILCIWNPTTNETNFLEYTTNALGTVEVQMSVNISSNMVRLVANPPSGTWSIKMLRFVI